MAEPKNVSERLAKAGAMRADEQRTHGFIGYVTKYYPATFKNKRYAHTCDVNVIRGNRTEKLSKVPCFVYSSGLIDKGLEENDRVWIQYINGDPSMPIITGYYREPTTWDYFKTSIYYSVSQVLDDWL